jgi:hypothetical protein
MRSYIFTARERQVIHAFLKGEIPETGKEIGMIRLRMRTFKDLARDVDLYLDLRRRLAKAEAAVSA